MISRHANQLPPDARPPRESVAYAGGDEKEGEASDRKQKKKKKRRQKDEGSWDQPNEAQEAPSEGPAPAAGDDPYQRVGPRRDKGAGGPGGDGAWEEQIGKSGGRGKRGKSRKKLPEEWAATAEPFVPAGPPGPEEEVVPLGVGEAAPSLPAPEEPLPGTEPGWSGLGPELHPEEGLVPDPLEQDSFFSVTPAPPLVQSSGLKATAAPFTMPAVSSPLGSSPRSPGPAYSLEDGVLGDELDSGLFDTASVLLASCSPYPSLTDTSAFSPASQLSPDQCLKTGASPWQTGPSDSSWMVPDSGDSFDLGDYPGTLGCPLPASVVLEAGGPAPLRSPRTSAQDCHGPPREGPDETQRSSSSSSSLKSPTFGGPPLDSPVPLASSPQTGSYLNPTAKPFFPGLNEPLEAPAVAPSEAPVMEGWLGARGRPVRGDGSGGSGLNRITTRCRVTRFK